MVFTPSFTKLSCKQQDAEEIEDVMTEGKGKPNYAMLVARNIDLCRRFVGSSQLDVNQASCMLKMTHSRQSKDEFKQLQQWLSPGLLKGFVPRASAAHEKGVEGGCLDAARVSHRRKSDEYHATLDDESRQKSEKSRKHCTESRLRQVQIFLNLTVHFCF